MENGKDVRRPNRIFRFKPNYTINGNGEKQPNTLEDPLPEYMHFIGMLFSMFGLMMKHKFCAWCALLCSLVGFANSRATDDGKQVLSSFMLSIAAIVMCYVQNPAPMNLPWA